MLKNNIIMTVNNVYMTVININVGYRLICYQTVVNVIFYAPLLELIQTRGKKKEVDLVLY